MYKVEGAYFIFSLKKTAKKIHPRLNSKFQISIGSWNYMWNGCVNLMLGCCVNIYMHVISMALICLHQIHLCYTTFPRPQNIIIFVAA
jgi:hypothetical protein